MGKVTELDRMRANQAQRDQEADEAEALERTLKPFNPYGVPYNREAVIQRALSYAEGVLGNSAGLGMCLVLLEEHESDATFTVLMAEYFPWINRDTYFRLMRFARFAAKSPKFMKLFGHQGMMRKGLALLSGMSDPEIDDILIELEETGEVKGLTEADLLGKTYRQMVLENKRLRLEMNRKVEAATEKLTKENLRLKKRNEELQEEAGMVAGLEKELQKLEAGISRLNEGRLELARADWQLLRRDAGGRALCKETFDQLRRLADWLESLVD